MTQSGHKSLESLRQYLDESDELQLKVGETLTTVGAKTRNLVQRQLYASRRTAPLVHTHIGRRRNRETEVKSGPLPSGPTIPGIFELWATG